MWINAQSHNVEKSFKKFLDFDPDMDDFLNLITSPLTIDTSLLELSGRCD